jgi:hypothetical protein
MPWSVVVTEPNGNLVASGQGDGPDVDWTWDARTVPAGKYRYAIDAGPSVRPATGVIAGRSTSSPLTALARPALITPNGDGKTDRTLVDYRLREPSMVTATVVDSTGLPVTTLFVAPKDPGRYSFPWDAFGLADGRYGVTLTARNALGIETTATMAVIVDRTLAGFYLAPQVFSPNNDGRLDTTRFGFTLNNPARVTINLRRGGKPVGQIFSGQLAAGTHSIPWNGRFAKRVGEREYRADIRATSTVSTVKQTVALAVDTTGPVLKLVSAATLTFRINEPGDVTVIFDGTRTVTRRRVVPGKFKIPPGGAYTSFRAIARDFAGTDGRAITRP